ncbi:MAG TPA: glycosyltransferase family 2 protein [Cytophagaceae bacterium]
MAYNEPTGSDNLNSFQEDIKFIKSYPELVEGTKDSEEGLIELLRLENAELKNIIKEQEDYNHMLLKSIEAYGLRISEIESSRLWKLKKIVNKIKFVLTSPNYAPGKKYKLLQRFNFLFSIQGRKLIYKVLLKSLKFTYRSLLEPSVKKVKKEKSPKNNYEQWRAKNSPREIDFIEYQAIAEILPVKPKISVVLSVTNTEVNFLKETITSILDQIYSKLELIIVYNELNDEYKNIITKYANSDIRIKLISHLTTDDKSKNYNYAISEATGEYICFIEQNDELTRDALYQLALMINHHPSADLIYTDEDKIDENGKLREPHFKPSFCPDNLLSRNYIHHLALYRLSKLKSLEGFRTGFVGAEEYDLLLRFTETTKEIYNIPKVLYHWRMHKYSISQNPYIKPFAYVSAKKAIEETLVRRKEEGVVEFSMPGTYSIRYNIKEWKRVSIIIPTKDKTSVLKTCLESIFNKSTYPDFEVIVIDNGSTEKQFFELMNHFQTVERGRFSWHSYNIPFNYSKLINFGVEKSLGDYLLLLNNDTEVISNDWIEGMVEQAQRESIGVVGVKLLFPNETIQHAGVVIGMGGVASHVFTGKHKDAAGYFNFINSISNYSAVTAACIMVRRELFMLVNGFEEDLEVELNDIDFCLRLKEKGYNNIYIPHVVLYHHESISRGNPHASNQAFQKQQREKSYFLNRWKHKIDNDSCFSPNLCKYSYEFDIQG